MTVKTFTVGLLTAAVTALKIDWSIDDYRRRNTPRVTLKGPAYTSIPFHIKQVDEFPLVDNGRVSTDDDRFSSSDSDSISSSDEQPVVEEETCE